MRPSTERSRSGWPRDGRARQLVTVRRIHDRVHGHRAFGDDVDPRDLHRCQRQGHLTKRLGNPALAEFLQQRQPDVPHEFRSIVGPGDQSV